MCIDFQISKPDFLSNYQEKKPLLIRNAVSPDLFAWKDANEIFERCDVASPSFKLSYEGIRPKHEYVERYMDIGTVRHRLIKPVVYEYMRKGATLIANKIKHEPKVSQFAQAVGEFTGRQVVSSAYAAFGSQSSFRAHWDTRDVFAIQLIGRKRWIIYEPSLEAPLYTQQSKDYERLYPCPKEPCMDFILEAGDMFYLPRGWWHNPLPLGEETFHLALGTFPAYTMDYLNWAMQRMQHFVGARQSMSDWENDRERLADVGRHLNTFINDPGNYRRFMDEFTATQRVESPLAIERFGNPKDAPLDEHLELRICAHALHDPSKSYIIANGTRRRLDEREADLIRRIAEHPGIRLKDILDRVPDSDTDAWKRQVADLCRLDILQCV